MGYNPSAPNTVGLEWMPTLEQVVALSSKLTTVGFVIASTVTETIDALYLPHSWSGVASGYGRLWCDVYDLASSPIGGGAQTLTYFPNEDKARSSNLTGDGYQTSNLFARIDDASNDESADGDYIWNNNSSAAQTYRCQFGSGGISSSKRIIAVTFQIRAKGFDWSWQQPSIDVEWWNGSTKVGKLGTIYPPQDYQWRNYTLGPFYLDPYNEGPWLQPAIAALDNNAAQALGFTMRYSCAISRVAMEVSVVDETRVAVGISPKQTTLPAGVQTNLPLSLKTPLNVDNWAKTSGKNYLFVVRRLDDPLALLQTLIPQPIYLDAGTASPHGQGGNYSVELADQGGNVTSYARTTNRVFAPVLATTGGASSVDSQPYHDIAPTPVHTTQTIRQGVSGASAQSYRRVRALIGIASGAPPSSPLTFAVKRTSDNSQLGGTGSLTVADLANPSIATSKGTITVGSTTVALYDVTVTLSSSATLATSTSYYVEASSSAASSAPWYVVMLDATASHSLTGNQTLGGSNDAATIAGSAQPSADFAITLGSTPTAPASVNVTLETIALPNGNSMQYARIDWPSTSMGAGFARYEVERTVDGGDTWAPIRSISTESSSSCDDYEGPTGVAAQYRVRVVRSDGAFSDWTTQVGTVTPTMSSGLCVFTSNADPSITTGFWLLGNEIEVDFLTAAETVLMKLQGRDFQVGFKPLEDRGFSWPFTVVVHADRTQAPSSGAGMRGWSPIRNVSDAVVPYVCMKTFDGERFFGIVQSSKGKRIEPSHLYLASVVFTQSQADSTAVED